MEETTKTVVYHIGVYKGPEMRISVNGKEAFVNSVFVANVKYGSGTMEYGFWKKEILETPVSPDDLETYVTGRAPGFIYALFAGKVHHPDKKAFIIGGPAATALEIVYCTDARYEEQPGRLLELGGGRKTARVCDETPLTVIYVGSDPANVFDENGERSIMAAYKDATGQSLSSLENLSLVPEKRLVVDENFIGLYHSRFVEMMNAVKTEDLILSCSSLSAIWWMMGSECSSNRYSRIKNIWLANRIPTGKYDLVSFKKDGELEMRR